MLRFGSVERARCMPRKPNHILTTNPADIRVLAGKKLNVIRSKLHGLVRKGALQDRGYLDAGGQRTKRPVLLTAEARAAESVGDGGRALLRDDRRREYERHLLDQIARLRFGDLRLS